MPSGERGYWQIGIRSDDDPFSRRRGRRGPRGTPITVTVMYSNHFGGHETESQFIVARVDGDAWITSATRHWGIGHR